jgi:ribosome biogenesis GTPase
MGRAVIDHPTASQPLSLASLGWSDFFEDQREPHEADFAPMRIAAIHRSRLTALSQAGSVELALAVHANTGDFTVGDWILADPRTQTLHRRLSRRTVMERRTEGSRTLQAAAANVDTLFIVTSCNADFNPARLERYLALANQGGTTSVILLTKADTTADLGAYQRQASQLQRGLDVLTINPRLPTAAGMLAPWCGVGRTVALVGSSGVGKSTGEHAGRSRSGPCPADRRHSRARCEGTPHDHVAIVACNRRRWLGHRHAGNANAARQWRRGRDRHPVCRDRRTRALVPIP